MAVPEQTPYKEYTANGITKIFPLEFDVLEQDHLIVLVNDLEPSVGSWSLDVINDTVVFALPPVNGANIKIRRDTPMSRSTDYQTYNNSFRPEPVNKDLDNIWRKLQEMGVLNWMIDNNIKDLGDYVDSLNDETKAQFLAEIQKQGVSMQQLDIYVNGLYQKLANTAVEKGWFAEFIADGNENQKQINDEMIRNFESIDDLLRYHARKDGQTVFVKSYYPPNFALLIPYQGSGNLIADLDSTDEHDGAIVFVGVDGVRWKRVKADLLATQAGCKEGDFDNTDLINNAIESISKYNFSNFILDGMFKIGKLEKGITTTPFGDEPIYWLLKAKSNVTIQGRNWSDGLVLEGGLVASNAGEAQTKGYCVFGDYNQLDIENFLIENFTIDNNGYNNLLPIPNSYGSQALCPNMWFQRGKKIASKNIHYLNNPGHQTIVMDSGVTGVEIHNNQFTDNGRGLLGNNNIWDHSTIYIRATDFTITQNKGIVTAGRLPPINTFLEIHGKDGHVHSNTGQGYPAPIIRASFFGQYSVNVKVHNNTFYNCTNTVELDASPGSTLIAEVYDNTFYLRSEVPDNNRQNVGGGHSQYSFAGVSVDSGTYSELHFLRNRVVQIPQVDGWSVYNDTDNVVFRGGKINKVVSKGNTFINFRGARQINYRNNTASYEFQDTFINCGNDNNVNYLFNHQNIDAAWSGGQTAKIISDDILIDCGYKYVNNYIGTPPLISKHDVDSTRWITPFIGDPPESATSAQFLIKCDVIDPSQPIYATSIKVFGEIKINNGQQVFWKDVGSSRHWNMKRRYDALAAPELPRFFGDTQGDIVENTAPSSGQPISYICTVSGMNANTVGTWKSFGLVS